jgi:pseudouridine kinase
MEDKGHILVVGACGIDIKGISGGELTLGADIPGQVRQNFGGVARNVAENLARLEVDVILLSAVGSDLAAERLIQHGVDSGIDMQHVKRCPDARTGAFLSLLNPAGDLAMAINDYDIMQEVDADYLDAQHEVFESARMLVIDLNMTGAALITLLDLADHYQLPVIVDPTSPLRAGTLVNYLSRLYMVVPNAAETTSLCGLDIPAHDHDSAIAAASHLISMGTKIAIVTLGEQGLAYADGNSKGHIPAVTTEPVDTTGAGDALTAGVIFGLIHDMPLDEAMRLGVTAASLSLQSEESVAPNLSPDILYDSLVV